MSFDTLYMYLHKTYKHRLHVHEKKNNLDMAVLIALFIKSVIFMFEKV